MNIIATYIESLQEKITLHEERIAITGVPTEDYRAELARLQAYRDCLGMLNEKITEAKGVGNVKNRID